ncbi:MAG: DUF799 family lipoprotein [Nitrospinae bacterium]|nr:DUF799 family lipoprotein [Nitrospinota bacterium]
MTDASNIYYAGKTGSGIRRLRRAGKIAPLLALTLMFTACTTNLQTKVSGNLNQLSKQLTVAILPVEVIAKGQAETAALFRQTLYANLKESKFNLLERYVVDGLLKRNNLTNPSQFLNINPMRFAEILGVDAVLISRINKVERSYLILHSSIEIGVSVQMVDTRTGEILWRAEQTESDFQGIGKIPTGITAAILGPLQFVTNKLNLYRLTSKLVNKLTAIIKKPEEATKEEIFEKPLIASAATRELKKMEEIRNLEAEWADDVAAYTEVPDLKKDSPDTESDPNSNTESSRKVEPTPVGYQPEAPMPIAKPASETEEMKPTPIQWTPRKNEPEPEPTVAENISTALPVESVPTQTDVAPEAKPAPAPKETQSALPRYTIQVGAYKTKTNAERMMRRLSGKGYKTYVTPYSKNGTTLFKVNVEKFTDKQQAYTLAHKLTQKENLKNFVTTINPG